MKIVSHEQIMQLDISPLQCYEWVEEMLKNKDEAVLPAKISMKQKGHIFYNVMPCILPQNKVAGVKIITRYPDRVPSLDSLIMLYNFETGELKAILDCNYITAMRTGAVAAHSIQLFAINNYETIGMIGLGNTARAAFKVLIELNKGRKLNVKMFSYKNHAELFINEFKKYNNIKFITCSKYEEIINNSDVVISCVTFTENDFCTDEFFKEGCLVVPVHTRGFQNCDLFFDKVFADDTGHVKDFKYFNKFRNFAEVSDVLKGRAQGRINNKERIIVYNIGIAIHDIFFAEKIYQILNSGTETNVNFKASMQKFWI
jgi:alanine dehydrogenase